MQCHWTAVVCNFVHKSGEDKYCWTQLHVDSEKVQLIKESSMVVTRAWVKGDMERCWPKGPNFQL